LGPEYTSGLQCIKAHKIWFIIKGNVFDIIAIAAEHRSHVKLKNIIIVDLISTSFSSVTPASLGIAIIFCVAIFSSIIFLTIAIVGRSGLVVA